ncbi:hypothetical protein ACSQ67_016801 [Phaseolus vulgaris]
MKVSSTISPTLRVFALTPTFRVPVLTPALRVLVLMDLIFSSHMPNIKLLLDSSKEPQQHPDIDGSGLV